MPSNPNRHWMVGTGPAMTSKYIEHVPSLRGLREGRRGREVDHFQRGADALRGAILEADHGVDGNGAAAAVDGIDDVGVFLVDDAAADLSGARQFAVVGVELLVEQQETGDALRRRQR